MNRIRNTTNELFLRRQESGFIVESKLIIIKADTDSGHTPQNDLRKGFS